MVPVFVDRCDDEDSDLGVDDDRDNVRDRNYRVRGFCPTYQGRESAFTLPKRCNVLVDQFLQLSEPAVIAQG